MAFLHDLHDEFQSLIEIASRDRGVRFLRGHLHTHTKTKIIISSNFFAEYSIKSLAWHTFIFGAGIFCRADNG